MEPRDRAQERRLRRRVGRWVQRLRRHGRPTRLRLWWWALVGLAAAGALAFQESAGDPAPRAEPAATATAAEG